MFAFGRQCRHKSLGNTESAISHKRALGGSQSRRSGYSLFSCSLLFCSGLVYNSLVDTPTIVTRKPFEKDGFAMAQEVSFRDIQVASSEIGIREIGLNDLWQALKEGFDDFKAKPSHLPFLVLFYFGADPDNSILRLSWDLCARAALATINKTA